MGIFDIFRKSPAPQKAAPRVSTRRYRAPADKTSPGGWYPFGGSVERAPAALPLIRSRARDLAHNNPYASRAVSVLTSHTVGSGVRFSIRGDADYEAEFNAWASSTDCDYEGRLNLYGIQAVAVRTMFEAGDAFIVVRQARISTGLRPTLQLVDPDQLDEGASPKGKMNRVIAGAEVDRTGRVVGYHIRGELDGTDSVYTSEFIRASDVIHIFEQLHPGQVRGIPRGAQALVKANTVDSFLAAALAKARTEACFTAFVTGPTLDDSAGIIGEMQDDGEFTIPEMLEPGTIIPLPDGHGVTIAAPSASGGLRDYVEIGLQAVAVSYGVTYAQLSGDVSKANYSSEKASRMEFYRSVDTTRAHFVTPALSRIEKAFRLAYEASEGRDVEARVSMTAPGRESIEPSKDAAADMISLAAGGLTFSQYCLARGLDPEDQLQSLQAERAHMAELGIVLKFGSVDIGGLLDASTAPNPDETDEDEDPAAA